MAAAATSGLITVSNGSEAVSVAIAFDPNFYQRVALITTNVAIQIYNETSGGATITGHTARASRAVQWLGQCSTPSAQIAMAMAVCAQNTINESSTSQQIGDQVTALWNVFSGV